jgi:hypothetical protein
VIGDQQVVIDEQRSFCAENHSEYVAVFHGDIAGFATGTTGLLPLNGLRHPPQGDTCGWYLWNGDPSMQEDFFKPTHVSHIYEEYPLTRKLLGLAPGFRFLSAGDYLDVWFDPHLLGKGEK